MRLPPEAQDEAAACYKADAREEVARHLPSLFGLAVALTGDVSSAEDLLQSAATRVLASTAEIQEIQSMGAYIRRTLINLHTDGLRRLRVERIVTAKAARATRTDTDPIRYSASRMDVGRALATLPELTRTVIILRFLEDLTAEEIGRTLHKPAGTIRRITHEGVRELRSSGLLDEYGRGSADA